MLTLLLVSYWRWRSRRRKSARAPSASVSSGKTPSSRAAARSQEPASPLALLQGGDVVIAMDKKGLPHKLGEGTYGEV